MLLRKCPLALFALALCPLPACSRHPPTTAVTPAPGDFTLFVDHPSFESCAIIVISPTRVFLQQADFPSLANRRWHETDNRWTTSPWLAAPGNAKPPFLPEGPNQVRILLASDGTTLKDTQYFVGDPADLRTFLQTIEAATKTNPLTTLPDWITAHPGLTAQLGTPNRK